MKRILAITTYSIFIVLTIFYIYWDVRYIVPNVVDVKIVDLNIVPADNESEEALSCEEADFERERYQTEALHLHLTAKYSQRGNEYIANYNKDFESRDYLRHILHQKGIKEDKTVNAFINENNKLEILEIGNIEIKLRLLVVYLFFPLALVVFLLSLYKAIFYRNVLISPIQYRKSIWSKLSIPLQSITFDKSIFTLGLEKRIKIGVFILCSLPMLIGIHGFLLLRSNDPAKSFMMVASLVFLLLLVFCFFISAPVRISKEDGIVWRSYFRPSKRNTIAKIEDIQGLELINQHINFMCQTVVNFVLKDNTRVHLTNSSVLSSRKSNTIVNISKHVADYLSVSICVSITDVESKISAEQGGLIWQTVRKKIGFFNKLMRRGEYLVLDYSLSSKALFYGMLCLFFAYSFYIFYVYPSEVNIICCVALLLFCFLHFYPFCGVLSPKKFNLAKSFYCHRPIYNLFGYKEIGLDKIEFLYLLCVHGYKEQPSIIQLNMILEGGERINLLTTISYKKAIELAKELANGINKPLFIDPFLQERVD